MRSLILFIAVALLVLTASASQQAAAQIETPSSLFAPSPQSQSSRNEISAENSEVLFINKVRIPAEVEGKLIELNIEEGSNVDEGAIVGVVDDTAAKLALELKRAEEEEALLNAANEINLKDAISSEELARAEAAAYKQLYEQKAIPYWEMEKKRLEAERANLRIDLAEMQMKIEKAKYIAKRSEREIADFEVRRRRITAPFSGYIETRTAQEGEWVQAGSPIATLVKLDKLRVEGDVDALAYSGQIVAGTPVRVVIYNEVNRDRAITIDSKLGFVSSEVDSADRYRVWVEIDNQKSGDHWMIKPGMKAEIMLNPGN